MEKTKFSNFFRNISYSVGANLLSLVISVITTLLVPKFFGSQLEQYGYLQIYLFYVSYVGFFHFGWCDGIFLRAGGKKYNELDKSLYSSQFWLIAFFEIIVSIIIFIIGYVIADDTDSLFIFHMIAISILLFIPANMLSYFLQTTNRIKEYAVITIIGRVSYVITIIFIIFENTVNYKFFICADLISKTFALVMSVLICKDIIFTRPVKLNIAVKEAIINISVGIKLLIANIASMLVTGIVKWGIQVKWDVETYGKISFTLSVSNLLLTFISAIALVLYPTLRRTEKEKLPGLYSFMNNCLMVIIFFLMIFYYPIKEILSLWIPQFAESMQFMAILFPVCVYASKMTMIIQTYMNVFRLEKLLLKINIVCVIIAIITTFLSVFVFENLTLAMFSIVVNQMARSIYAEIELSKKINIRILKDLILEFVMSSLFIIINWYLVSWKGVILYAFIFILYLLLKFKDIKKSIKVFHTL